MAKGSGGVRATARRQGLTLAKLPNGGAASGGKYKYAIRGAGTNMRAKNLREASRLLSANRGHVLSRFDITRTGYGNTYQVNRKIGPGRTALVTGMGGFRSRRAAEAAILRYR